MMICCPKGHPVREVAATDQEGGIWQCDTCVRAYGDAEVG